MNKTRFLLIAVPIFVSLGCNNNVSPSINIPDSAFGKGDNNCIPMCDGRECGDDGCGGSCWKGNGLVECEDGLNCTTDSCSSDGRCVHQIEQGTCLVNGKCAQAGDAAPDNPCMICDPDTNKSAYSPAQDKRGCDNGKGRCFMGKCCYPECKGKACGDDGCGGDCAGPSGCDDGLDCTQDSCDNNQCHYEIKPDTCMINGKCYKKGDSLPGKECSICDPSISVSDWSMAPDGTKCGSNGVCANGKCCTPQCAGKECGDDGCGGSCGDCGKTGACRNNQCYTAGSACDGLQGLTCVDGAVVNCLNGRYLYVLNCQKFGMDCECDSNISKCSLIDADNGLTYACTKDGCSDLGNNQKGKCIDRRFLITCQSFMGHKLEMAIDCMQYGKLCTNGQCKAPSRAPCGTLVGSRGLCAGTYAYSCNNNFISVENCMMSNTYCDYSEDSGLYQCL